MRPALKSIFLITVFLLVSASCVRRPSRVASDKKMTAVLADLELSEAWLQNSGATIDDNKRDALTDYVIGKHRMSRAEFDSTMLWYGRNPDAYFELCELADKELLKKQRNLSGKSTLEYSGEDLWPFFRHVSFSSLSPFYGMVFSVPAEETDPGSQYQFKMRFLKPVRGQIRIALEYEDGNVEFLQQKLSGVSRSDVHLYADTAKIVKRIFGNIELEKNGKSAIWGDSISLTVLPFDSTKYYNRHLQRHLSVPVRKQIKKTSSENDSINKVGSNN